MKDDTEQLEALIRGFRLKADTSMERWHSYWRERVLLRQIAMESYDSVIEAYSVRDQTLEMPSEGFKEIAKDITDQMRVVGGDIIKP